MKFLYNPITEIRAMATFLVEVENKPIAIRSDDTPTDAEEKKPSRQPRKSLVLKDPEHYRRRTISDAGRRGTDSRDRGSSESARIRHSLQWIRRFSQAGSQKKSSDAPPVNRVHLENTYRLGPDEWTTFNESEARRVINEVLASYLDGEQYHADRCRNMAKQLGDVIKSRMQMIKNERYRIIAMVSLAQNGGQGYHVASRCLWDANTDRFTSVNYKNATLLATVIVYAVYYE